MSRGIATALFVATAALLGAQKSSTIDREKLDLIRRMSPEERAKLKARLEELKKLPVEERERLSQNLQKIKSMPLDEVKKLKEKGQRLSPDEQKQYADLAQGFFHWARRQGYADGFPRGVFFAWLKRERAEKMKEIRDMEVGVAHGRVRPPLLRVPRRDAHPHRAPRQGPQVRAGGVAGHAARLVPPRVLAQVGGSAEGLHRPQGRGRPPRPAEVSR